MIVSAKIAQQKPAHAVPIFEAIARTQRAHAERYCIVAMADHARMAGSFAQAFDPALVPYLDDDMLGAVSIHDSGWTYDEGCAPDLVLPELDAAGRPRSFLDLAVETSLSAWTRSICCAEEIGPAPGSVVSRHFTQLAEHRLRNGRDGNMEKEHLQQFLTQEMQRQARMAKSGGFTPDDLTPALDVLRLCDLLSLYVCCGVTDRAEFPIDFGRGRVHAWRVGDTLALENAPLHGEVQASCPAYEWAVGKESQLTAVPLDVILKPAEHAVRLNA